MNQQLIRKVQKMQQEMMAAQKEIEESVFSKKTGVVTVTVTGTKEVKEVAIDEDFTIEGPEDLEMLGDMIVAACNLAYKDIEKMTEEKLGKYQALLGGMGSFF
ncbi:MAG: YbaB/EbfC family nucleoid-associated protein [Bacilli bacterium]|jgi:DNA-binding YbaB/EbfC family protein|nr:YbaB/EbfC family nucleoid-associated protein [Bacilli bacterium]HHU24069.1 YbaB/EbfC family nucleoid-associated protein [Acholeplasmataceae bacterium]